MMISRKFSTRKILLIICSAVILLAVFSICSFHAAAAEHAEKRVQDAWGRLSYFTEDNKTVFDIQLHNGSVVVGGREVWNAGDQIVFRVKASDGARYQVGILPAEDLATSPEYNSYGGFISEELYVDEDWSEVIISVPETGEYGIGIQHYRAQNESAFGTFSDVHMDVEVNKVFENPF